MFTTAQKTLFDESLTDSLSSTSLVHADKTHPKSAGRWTKEEHQRFIDGLKKFGKNWKQVEEHVGTRTGAQIRSHAQKFFNRLEREYNLRLDSSKIQTSQQLTESLRKISEVSVSTNSSVPNEVTDDSKMEEIHIMPRSPAEKDLKPLPPLIGFESPVNRNVFFQETQSVPSDSPKRNALEGLSNYRRSVRKMSEDVIAKHSLSMFEVMLSKIRTSKNGIDFPKLSDLVDMDLSSDHGFRSYPNNNNNKLNNNNKGHQQNNGFTVRRPSNASFRKFSEDNILFNTRYEQARRPSCNELSEFDLFSKKIKKD